MATLEGTGMDHTHIIGVKEISAVVKKLKQLQIKPRKHSEAPTGFEPMTSAIPVRCSTD